MISVQLSDLQSLFFTIKVQSQVKDISVFSVTLVKYLNRDWSLEGGQKWELPEMPLEAVFQIEGSLWRTGYLACAAYMVKSWFGNGNVSQMRNAETDTEVLPATLRPAAYLTDKTSQVCVQAAVSCFQRLILKGLFPLWVTFTFLLRNMCSKTCARWTLSMFEEVPSTFCTFHNKGEW